MKTQKSLLEQHGQALALAALLLAVTSLSFFMGSSDFETSLTEMLIRVVIVIGLWVFIGNSGIISFGHVAFCCIGAYAAAWANADPSFKQIMLSGLPTFLQENQYGFTLSLIGASMLAALSALVLGAIIMRLSGIASSIATFAFLIMVNSIYSNWDSVTAGASSIVNIPTVVGPWTAFGMAILVLLVAHLFRISRYGLMLQASRDDEVAAKASGINIFQVRLISFVLSAAIVGVGGGLYAHFLGILTVDVFYLNLAFITLAMLVVGGMAELGGAVLGVVVVTMVVQSLRLFERGFTVGGLNVQLPHGSQELGLGLILALILIFSSKGIFALMSKMGRRV